MPKLFTANAVKDAVCTPMLAPKKKKVGVIKKVNPIGRCIMGTVYVTQPDAFIAGLTQRH